MEWKTVRHNDLSFLLRYNLCEGLGAVLTFEVIEIVSDVDEDDSDLLFYEKDYRSSGDVTTDVEKAHHFIEGYLKWDGCINYEIRADHGCGRKDVVRIGEMFNRLYDLGNRLMPNEDGYFE